MNDTDYVLGRTAGEYERLIEQAELIRPLTERMLLAAGVCAGMHVLDVGCGVGDVSFLVSELVGQSGSVIGIDLDPVALEVAESRRAARRLTNVEFRVGDVGSVDFEHQFDAAVGRFVLMYVDDPTAVLCRLGRALRPGGIVAFHEWVAHMDCVSAEKQPLLASMLELFARTFERSGASLDVGLELYSRMVSAGFEPTPTPLAEIGLQLGQDSPGPRRWALLARSMLPRIIESGLASEAELDVDTLEQRLRDEGSAASGIFPVTYLMVGQWARKPALNRR
jgi:ubiquinone/menaquinone biosynthesis C-methylase UbiE